MRTSIVVGLVLATVSVRPAVAQDAADSIVITSSGSCNENFLGVNVYALNASYSRVIWIQVRVGSGPSPIVSLDTTYVEYTLQPRQNLWLGCSTYGGYVGSPWGYNRYALVRASVVR